MPPIAHVVFFSNIILSPCYAARPCQTSVYFLDILQYEDIKKTNCRC